MKRVLLQVFFALTALTIAGFGAAAGAWVGWQGAKPLPSNSASLEAVHAAYPGSQAKVINRTESLFGYHHQPVSFTTWLLGDFDYGLGAVTFDPRDFGDGGNFGDVTARLEAAGWQATRTDEGYPKPDHITATNGDVVLRVDRTFLLGFLGGSTPTTTVKIERAQPDLVRWLGLAGWLVGLAVGVWLAVFVRSRSSGATLALRLAIAVLALLTWRSLVYVATLVLDGSGISGVPPFVDWMAEGWGRILTVAGLALLIGAVVGAVLIERRKKAPRPELVSVASGGDPSAPAAE